MERGRTKPVSRPESQARTRSDLIEATRRVFIREGLEGTTVGKIATEAGYTTGAVYSNFDGKLDLLFALIEQQSVLRAASRTKVADSLPGDDAKIDALASLWQATVEDSPEVYQLLIRLRSLSVDDPQAGERYEELDRRIRERLALLLDEEFDLEFAVPVEVVAGAVQSLSNGYAMRQLRQPDPQVSVEFARAVKALFRGLTG